MNRLNKLYWEVVLAISIIPLTATIIFRENYYYYWIGLISFIIILSLGVIIFFWIHIFKFFVPIIINFLSGTSHSLSPIVNYLNNTKVIGPIVSWCIKVTFFFWFFVLLLSDMLIRMILSRVAGIHEGTGSHFSPISASDTNFQPLGLFENREEEEEEEKKNNKLYGEYFPKYSKKLASSLAIASKIAYEDVPIIKYELEKAGYNMNSFLPIAYKNVCGYIVEKDDDIILVFRGSNPLNIQNCLTDIRALLRNIESTHRGLMGLVHEGFHEAIGEDLVYELKQSRSQTIIELTDTSFVNTVKTIFSAFKTLMFFAFQSIITHVHDPVDHRYLGEDMRSVSAYRQATNWISKLCKETNGEKEKNGDSGNESGEESSNVIQRRGERKSKKRLYIAGHSLGGGLATVFLAKLLKYNSPLLKIFAGIYTYGQPNVGDIIFAKSFGAELGKKMFHHAYNNDVVSRVPRWNPYSSPPGNLVFIDASFSIYIYPPDPVTNIPIPIRGISFLNLSGLLNLNVIKRMKDESWLRILYRMLFPFFINDHFPGDYVRAIREGKIERVVIDVSGQGGGFEK